MNILQLGRFRIFSKILQKFEICNSYILLISLSENILKAYSYSGVPGDWEKAAST
jgi:hypothetical protein